MLPPVAMVSSLLDVLTALSVWRINPMLHNGAAGHTRAWASVWRCSAAPVDSNSHPTHPGHCAEASPAAPQVRLQLPTSSRFHRWMRPMCCEAPVVCTSHVHTPIRACVTSIGNIKDEQLNGTAGVFAGVGTVQRANCYLRCVTLMLMWKQTSTPGRRGIMNPCEVDLKCFSLVFNKGHLTERGSLAQLRRALAENGPLRPSLMANTPPSQCLH